MISNKTDTFFLVSNYNTDPDFITGFANNFLICDQSDRYDFATLKAKYGSRITKTFHSGHNLSDYFEYFADNYDNLPEFLALVKGNLVPRHISEEHFLAVYNNKTFTLLNSAESPSNSKSSFQPFRSFYVERNNDWYALRREYRYFCQYNRLLEFIFCNPVLPKYNVFSPGACYIISSAYVTKFSRQFWRNLHYLVTYTFFPAEAWHVERMLNLIFLSGYQVREHMQDGAEFRHALAGAEKVCAPTVRQRLRFACSTILDNLDR